MSALLFPPTPSDGDTYEGYIFNAAKNVWQWQALVPSVESLSDTVITTPALGEALVYDGTNWVNDTAGKILQVKSITKTNVQSQSLATGASVAISDFTVEITPSNTNSKFLIFASIAAQGNDSDGYALLLTRNGAATNYRGDLVGSDRRRLSAGGMGNRDIRNNMFSTTPLLFEDEPNTTSPVTYGVDISTYQRGATAVVFVNRTESDTDALFAGHFASTLTVMEVAG